MPILNSWDSLSIERLSLNLCQEQLKVVLGKSQVPPKHDGLIGPLRAGGIEGIVRQLAWVNRQATNNIPVLCFTSTTPLASRDLVCHR